MSDQLCIFAIAAANEDQHLLLLLTLTPLVRNMRLLRPKPLDEVPYSLLDGHKLWILHIIDDIEVGSTIQVILGHVMLHLHLGGVLQLLLLQEGVLNLVE